MPSKKKKYNSRFPPARIKKIMQTDEEIGKVAAAVPVLISKCLEMFLESLLTKAGEVTKSKRAKTMSRSHLKQCIMSETMFDFLKDQVENIPDVHDDEPSGSFSLTVDKDVKKPARKRSLSKIKKTPKKRAKLGHPLNNNDSDADEIDSGDDASDNGSGNDGQDGSDLMSSSFSSPGLLSPSVQVKAEAQSSKMVENQQDEGNEKKVGFHIPLDALLDKPLRIVTAEDTKSRSSQDETECGTTPDRTRSPNRMLGDGTAVSYAPTVISPPGYSWEKDRATNHDSEAHGHLHHTPALRKGVIVANKNAVVPKTSQSNTDFINKVSRSVSRTEIPSGSEIREPSKPKTASVADVPFTPRHASPDKSTLPHEADSSKRDDRKTQSDESKLPVGGKARIRSGYERSKNTNSEVGKSVPEITTEVTPPAHPGSMLSFLYSPASMSTSSVNVPVTVPHGATPQSTSSHPMYSYTPLSQHHHPEPDGLKPLRYHQSANAPPGDERFALPPQPGYPIIHAMTYQNPYRQYLPNSSTHPPYSSQSHFLGYPQALLTPPEHAMSANDSHPSFLNVKPKSRAKSDDDDYDA